MEELYEYRRRLIERYRAVADNLVAAIEKKHSDDFYTRLDDTGSSPQKIATHLLEVETRLFFPYLLRILNEEQPNLEYSQSVDEVQEELKGRVTPVAILEKYQQLRAQEGQILESLSLESWSRCVRHDTFGVRTLQWWVEHSLVHAEEHLRQL